MKNLPEGLRVSLNIDIMAMNSGLGVGITELGSMREDVIGNETMV